MESFQVALIVFGFFLFLYIIRWIISKSPSEFIHKDGIQNEQTVEKDEEKANFPQKKIILLRDFIGKKEIKEYIKLHLDFSLKNNKSFPHTILYGMSGLGKSTLAKIISNEMNSKLTEISPAQVSTGRQLLDVFLTKYCSNCLTANPYINLKCYFCKMDISSNFQIETRIASKDIIFLEECHALSSDIEEALYSAMQDYYIVSKSGGNFDKINLPEFTLIGATTKLGLLNEPFRQRFILQINLNPYTVEELALIIFKICKEQNIQIQNEVIVKIAEISFGTPRIAKAYLIDLIAMADGQPIIYDYLKELFRLKHVDPELGLTKVHRKILSYMLNRKRGAGARSLALNSGITQTEYEEVIEPQLLQVNLIQMADSGRILSEIGKQYINKE